MNLGELTYSLSFLGIPRVSGDEPQAKYIAQFQKEYSPRERG